MEEIIKLVCRVFKVKPESIASKNRTGKIPDARDCAIYFCWQEYKKLYTSQKVAERFGHKKHSSVFTSIRKVEQLIKTNKEFADKFLLINESI